MKTFDAKMKNSDRFDIDKFLFPDVVFAPVYIWVWNDICTREIIDTQLSEMQNLGIRAFYILPEPKNFRPDSMPTSLEPDYLTEEYFQLCAYALEKGKLLGMNCWLYDEGGWPSGSACGKVTEAHPEFARQVLSCCERSFSAGEIYKKTNPDVLAAFLDDNEIIEDGFVFSEVAVVTEYVVKKESGNYPDLLNKMATEYFIEITHKKYASAIKGEAGKIVSAVFTDEPKASACAFSKELAERFESEYGVSIIPYLPLISGRAEPSEENVSILHQWYDLCSHAFCDNFLIPCKEWANEHGMAFTGHLDKDHNPSGCVNGGGNFNLMRALRCLDIPGIDVIWRQLYPESEKISKDEMNCYNGFFPRYASSAAAQNGTDFAMSEIFGVAGPGLTYDIMRYTVGYQVVRGINIFNPFNFPLGRKGQLLAQELPVFTEKQMYYRHLHRFNRYTERLCYLASIGKRDYETGLYYPVSDFQGGLKADEIAEQFDALGRALEDINVDFDIVDDDVIQSAQITDGGSLLIGNAEYKKIIIPRGAYIPDDTKKALQRFADCGGNITDDISSLNPVVAVEGKGLRVMHRIAENAEVFCLFREAGESGNYCVHLPSANGYLLNPDNGSLQRIEAENGALSVSLAIGETAVVLLTTESFAAESNKKFSEKYELTGEFMFRKETELVCTESGFENIEYSDEPVCISLDTAADGLDNFSGSCVYEKEFALPAERSGKEGEINLGKVCYSASVYLNDSFLGTALTTPYSLKIPEGLLKEKNKIKIIVTNTSANWYINTDYFDKWKAEELSPYFEAEKNFAKDVAFGGLFGPVIIET